MAKEATRCAVCHEYFDVTRSVGRWECRTHIARERVLDDGRLVYPCCGLSAQDELTSYSFYRTHLSIKLMLGCVKADHVVARGEPGHLSLLRSVEDVHLLSDITQKNAFASIPNAAIIDGPRALSYGDIDMAAVHRPALMVVDFDVAGGARVTRDLRETARQAIELSYARDELYKSQPNQDLRRAALANKNNARGLPSKLKEFYEEAKLLSDDRYVVQWFTKMAPKDISVNMCVVRAVAPQQDGNFIAALKAQRTYASSHDPLR